MTPEPTETRPPQLVCASANPGKVAEMADLLAGVVEMLPRPVEVPEVIEDAPTLIGNARLKAAAIARAVGVPAVADDTGLEVDALGGAPGVRTARYAGEGCSDADNRAKLLAALDGNPIRSARFRTSVVVQWPDGREVAVEGVCEGSIAPAERGHRGFGYDAIFIPAEGDGRTFAEMTVDDKHRLSHRGRAMRALLLTFTD
jgi:XTP/dITP diphosphohydrolase